MIKPRHLPAQFFQSPQEKYEMKCLGYFILACFILCLRFFIIFSFFASLISFLCLCFFITFSFFCQSHFILLPALFHNFIILLPVLFHNLYIYLVMMRSNYKTCDLLIASIYILIAQLSYIMTSNTNKCKDQKPGDG